MGLTNTLFKLARLSADAKSVKTGRVPQRLANKAIGRTIPWNRIWR